MGTLAAVSTGGVSTGVVAAEVVAAGTVGAGAAAAGVADGAAVGAVDFNVEAVFPETAAAVFDVEGLSLPEPMDPIARMAMIAQNHTRFVSGFLFLAPHWGQLVACLESSVLQPLHLFSFLFITGPPLKIHKFL